MDIVEIVTTIAHKIWNCKHFSVSFRFGESGFDGKAVTKAILFPFSSIGRFALFVMLAFFILFTSFFRFFFAHKLRRCRFFYMDIFVLHWSQDTPITVPFDVSYAKMCCKWASGRRKRKTRLPKVKHTKGKRNTHTHTNESFAFLLEQTLAADSLFRALHFQFGFVFD